MTPFTTKYVVDTKVAPAYTSLFVGEFENHHKILLYKHYIDDLFFIWDGCKEEALQFTEILNTNEIKFTLKIRKTEIDIFGLNNLTLSRGPLHSHILQTSGYKQLPGLQRGKWKENVPYGKVQENKEKLQKHPDVHTASQPHQREI